MVILVPMGGCGPQDLTLKGQVQAIGSALNGTVRVREISVQPKMILEPNQTVTIV